MIYLTYICNILSYLFTLSYIYNYYLLDYVSINIIINNINIRWI